MAHMVNGIAKTDLRTVIQAARRLVDDISGQNRTLAVASFDLTSSVAMKVDQSHAAGTKAGLLHNRLCRLLVEAYGGQVLKELGDGVLCAFDDPLQACRAAHDIRQVVTESGLRTKGSVCLGIVEVVELDGVADILGTTVDRCARLLSVALPDQVLLDQPLHDATRSFLADVPGLMTGPALRVFLRGLGPTDVFELVERESDVRGAVHTPLKIYEEDPPDADEIAAFVASARQEVVAVGLGLPAFAEGFDNDAESTWADLVGHLLKKGVAIRVASMDPDWQGTGFYLKDRQEFGVIERLYAGVRGLKRRIDGLSTYEMSGTFEVLLYQHIPTFEAICVDPRDAEAGRLLVTSHLNGVDRNDAAAMQVAQRANPQLFDTYWTSVRSMLRDSRRA